MNQVYNQLLSEAKDAVQLFSSECAESLHFEIPKQAEHGDLALSVSMQLAKLLKQNPRLIAQRLVEVLSEKPSYKQWALPLEIAGMGFINIRLSPLALQNTVVEILQSTTRYGFQATKNQSVMLEYVSANPTGPLHIGHGRQGVLGDSLGNLLTTQGYQIHREFYYNDSGVQIDLLTRSIVMRIQGYQPDTDDWPENNYNGEYIVDIAKEYCHWQNLTYPYKSLVTDEHKDKIRQFAVAYLRQEQEKDLSATRLRFDQYYLESSLYIEEKVQEVVDLLTSSGYVFELEGALWLKTTAWGDDKDRVLRKRDGSYTYFVPDIAYHLSKWRRNFKSVINIQGSDHLGTMPRVRAGLQIVASVLGLTIPPNYPSYIFHTMVRVVKGDTEIKISKRSGGYITLREIIEWASCDAFRFLILSRKPDTEYIFDVDLARAQTNENPVYYIQYAHARIGSILRKADGVDHSSKDLDLSTLNSPSAIALALKLWYYPSFLTQISEDLAIHKLTFYLRDLAAEYHRYYDTEKVLVEDLKIRTDRLALIKATAQVIHNGLAILGVSAPESM